MNLFFICLVVVSTTHTILTTAALSLRRQKRHYLIQSSSTAHKSSVLVFPTTFQIRSSRTTGRRARSILMSTRAPAELSSAAAVSSKTTTTTRSVSSSSSSSMLRDATKNEFRGQTVLLTGASGGLGRSLALRLAECGVGTLILSARNAAALQQVASECQALAPPSRLTVHVIPADLADPASVEALAAATLQKCHNRIHVLINNGGVSSRSRFVDTDLTVDQRCMQINFLAGAALAKAVVPKMLQDPAAAAAAGPNDSSSTTARLRGRIIWISSVQGLVGIPNRSSYAASKFAVQGYCESIRAELAPSRVTVHCVSPGYLRTNLSVAALTGDGVTTHGVMDAATAQGADPDQVAATLLNKVVGGQTDFTIAAGVSAVAAIWMRLLCPGILQNLLVRRYEKSLLPKEKAD
jgi:dehydrogenase/reductase SDR family protein 7B